MDSFTIHFRPSFSLSHIVSKCSTFVGSFTESSLYQNLRKSDRSLLLFGATSTTVFLLGLSVLSVSTMVPSRHAVAQAATLNVVPSGTNAIQELNLANNGLLYVQNAKVTSVFGDTIGATITWGVYRVTWTVSTNEATHFLSKDGQSLQLSNIKKGDLISVTGNLDQTASNPSVVATSVRSMR